MSYILGEYERMEQKRAEYMELFGRLESEINALARIAAALKIPWEGSANKAYIIRFNADFIYFKDVLQKLYMLGRILGEAINEYQGNERSIAELIETMK